MKLRMPFRACAVLAVVLAFQVQIAAQAGVTYSGRLINSLSGDPIADAAVQIDELRRTATSAPDGTFTFDNVQPGTYHLSVRSQGYSSRRAEVIIAASAAPPRADITIDPELHFEEVTSVSAESRSQFETFQPTSVLAGQELSKQLEMSLGATLENQPGLASRSFGPAPARPVIRGLDGDRVLILQDGQRMGDLSSQSGDHGVTVNPAAAQTIEVVRGPATLLYGANAVGGLVNVITNDIPRTSFSGATGNFTVDFGSAATEAGAAADMQVGNGKVALHVGGGGRHSENVNTPAGEIENSQSRSGFGNLGAAWTGAKNYFGASYGYDDTKYGIPIIEGGGITLTPRKHAFSVRAGGESLDGALTAYRATLSVRRYKHEELEGAVVGTAFVNNTSEVEVMGAHRAIGRLKGSLGASALDRDFSAAGAEALSAPTGQRSFAGFLYEEIAWPHVTFQFGGRVDRASYTPEGEGERTFNTGSGSVGLLLRPAPANDRFVIAMSLARAARYPALEELFYFGLHPGNFAFEVGNPDVEPEHAIGFDLGLRWRGPRASGEVTYFRNSISNYLFRSPLSAAQLAARLVEFEARFPARDDVGERAAEIIESGEFPIVEYLARDSILQGVEAHTDFMVTPNFTVELGADYVRGELKDTGEPLPRIPPFRFRGGLRYQYNAFQAGGDVTATTQQDRLAENETGTDGYSLLKLFAAYSFPTAGAVSTITFRVDNVTDELYRNHLSLIKDFTPEIGRNLKLLYSLKF